MTKILAVDDNPQNLLFVVNTLLEAKPEYEVLVANNGKRALEVARETPPDLVIMDWEMPEMTGIEALKQFKEEERLNDIPVIMHTGINTESDDLSEALKLGAADFLRKPVAELELQARVKSILTQRAYFKEKVAAEKAQAEAELELRVRELTTLSLLIEQKNKFLGEVYEHTVQLRKQVNDRSLRQRCSELMRLIQNDIEAESQWELLKVRVNEMHDNFVHALKEAHDNLTKGDVKLASLLRLGLNTNEIADTLFISVGAVEKKRYRLRKKLELDGEQNLSEYIAQFS